jgi:hypothetical protein
MWRSSSHDSYNQHDGSGMLVSTSSSMVPPSKSAGTSGNMFFVPVHADHVNGFIAGEFSQWLGERYGYHGVEGSVHTGKWGGKFRDATGIKGTLDKQWKDLIRRRKDLTDQGISEQDARIQNMDDKIEAVQEKIDRRDYKNFPTSMETEEEWVASAKRWRNLRKQKK